MSDRKLGEGGYATVFMAVDRFTERQVACKIVKLKRVATHHCSSHYFGSTGNTSHAKIRPLLPKQPKPETLWREVELLKGISHVGLLKRLLLHRLIGCVAECCSITSSFIYQINLVGFTLVYPSMLFTFKDISLRTSSLVET